MDIRLGDCIEFSDLGAYSLAGRTRFNGHYSDTIVMIDALGVCTARDPAFVA